MLLMVIGPWPPVPFQVFPRPPGYKPRGHRANEQAATEESPGANEQVT
jgi:hypothetical protein